MLGCKHNHELRLKGDNNPSGARTYLSSTLLEQKTNNVINYPLNVSNKNKSPNFTSEDGVKPLAQFHIFSFLFSNFKGFNRERYQAGEPGFKQ